MEFRAKQILPPRDWYIFEDLCHTLFRAVWDAPHAQKNGRRGQPQSGVDIFGYRNGLLYGVQCKGRDGTYGSVATERDLQVELAKAESFRPGLSRWIFATTSPSDVRLQELARNVTAERAAKGQFGVDFLGWEEILQLLSENLDVAELYYPEHVLDVAGLIRRLEQTSATWEAHQWADLDFRHQRDLGPALMGHALGPADAACCPMLIESGLLAARLKTSFSARLYGDPGSGKSICAMQTAFTLTSARYRVKQLLDPSVGALDLPESSSPTMYIIDDAHLMPPGVLDLLERQARPDRLLLTTHNASDRHSLPPSAIALDARRAVRTIAAALRSDRARTIAAVRAADDHVGDRIGDTRLEHRLAEAERATFPWQFCFILGGGWRRTREAADKARVAGADLVLAGVALQQLASFDARSDEQTIIGLCASEGLQADETRRALDWLTKQRLLVSREDCRTPHQRFASVVLHRILGGREHVNRAPIFRLVDRVLSNPAYPLAGLSRLLEEYALNPDDYSWVQTVSRDVLLQLAERCWVAGPGDERGEAAHVLVQIDRYVDDWVDTFIRPHKQLVSSWMSRPETSGYGLARLLNNIMNKQDEVLLAEIVNAIDSSSLAQALSATNDRTLFGCSELVERIHRPSDEWRSSFSAALKRERLIAYARSSEGDRDTYLAVHAMIALSHLEHDLAVEMAEAFAPTAVRHLRQDLFAAYERLGDLFTVVLRVMGFFGERRRNGPTARERVIARSIFQPLSASEIGRSLSTPAGNHFQTASYFLTCLRHCLPRRARAAVAAIDWTSLGDAIGDAWADMPHEIEAYLGVLYSVGGRCQAPGQLVAANASRIRVFPPRLAFLAPETAAQHVAGGGVVSLVRYSHVDWSFGPVVISYCAEHHPHLLAPLLVPHLPAVAQTLSQPHASWYESAEPMLRLLRQVAPDHLAAVLRLIDPTKAETGWASCFQKGGSPAKAAAVLVEASLSLDGEHAEMAERLRKRFPTRSRPRLGD